MFEELVTRPGRVHGGSDKLVKIGERISQDSWEDAQVEYRQRYMAKMMGIPLPGRTSRGTLRMITVDVPWRDINMVDFNPKDFLENVKSMMTPIVQVGWNSLNDAAGNPMSSFGKGKPIVSSAMVEAPGWLRDHTPGDPMLPGVKGSGSGAKKRLGFELRPDPVLSASEGKQVMKEYIPESKLWYFNLLPPAAFLSRQTTGDLTKEQRALYGKYAYLSGFRMFEYDETMAQEANIFQSAKELHESQAPGRSTTAGRKRDAASDARVGAEIARVKERKEMDSTLQKYKRDKAAGKKDRGLYWDPKGSVRMPGRRFPGEGQKKKRESEAEIREKILRDINKGKRLGR
jgi:hypothetical protein